MQLKLMETLSQNRHGITHCVHHYSNWRERQRKSCSDHVMHSEGIVLSSPRGNLLSRSLIDIAKPDDFVQNSEYLQTLVVCVPRCVIVTL